MRATSVCAQRLNVLARAHARRRRVLGFLGSWRCRPKHPRRASGISWKGRCVRGREGVCVVMCDVGSSRCDALMRKRAESGLLGGHAQVNVLPLRPCPSGRCRSCWNMRETEALMSLREVFEGGVGGRKERERVRTHKLEHETALARERVRRCWA